MEEQIQTLYDLIDGGQVDKSLALFSDNNKEAEAFLKQYNPQQHSIKKRANKITGSPEGGYSIYVTEKLPRAWQRHINEIALFFLFNNPLLWSKSEETDPEVFRAFCDFLKATRFNSGIKEAKRKAGYLKECARLYHIYTTKEEGVKVKALVLDKENGYDLYPMFDIFGDLVAFAYSTTTKTLGKAERIFTIYTKDYIYKCTKKTQWEVEKTLNRLGKIPVIYYTQSVEWDGAQERIERDEKTDSTTADVNNYFASPVLVARGRIENTFDAHSVGRSLQLSQDAKVEYLEPPSKIELSENEKKNNTKAILQDTFTPDFSLEAMQGLGVISGVALKRAFILGYIKRNRNIEIYEPLIDREKNLILRIIETYFRPDLKAKIRQAQISFEFAEPLSEDVTTKINSISAAVSAGVLSVEAAVKILGMTPDPDKEIERLKQKEDIFLN